MPAVRDSIRSVLGFCCVTSLALLAACGGGDGGGGAAVASCPSTTTVGMAAAPAPGSPPAGIALALETLNAALNFPLFVTAPPGDPNRLFVVEKFGEIKVLNRSDGAEIGTFLDASGVLNPPSADDERGLLGLAFDPGYSSNGRFYISYIAPGDVAVVARYLVSGSPATSNVAVPTADSIIISTPYQPSGSVFGGMITFRDGLLYVSRGVGGSDAANSGQSVGTLTGKILRINVNADDFPADNARNYAIPGDNPCVGQAGAQPEIWSMGLRNPWRFSFDRATGDLYIGDVGGADREEINVAAVANGRGRGVNYGWMNMEGTQCFGGQACDPAGLQRPVVDYVHNPLTCNSVTGGYVYRGSAIPGLQGTYFYGDSCAGFVRSFRFANNAATEHATWPFTTGFMTSFGEDTQGELYITTAEGVLFRIIAQ